jgi:hypothetical protein
MTIMPALRILTATLFALGLLWLLLSTIFQGLRTGRIRYVDSITTCDRESRPLFFWFLVMVFAVFSVIIAAVWWQSVFS